MQNVDCLNPSYMNPLIDVVVVNNEDNDDDEGADFVVVAVVDVVLT